MGGKKGFLVTRQALHRELPHIEQRSNVTIHLPASVNPGLARQIADDHAFRVANISARLGMAYTRHVDSYVFANAERLEYWTGAKYAFAKPARNLVHVHGLRPCDAAVAHEMTHVIAAPLAGWLGVSARHGIVIQTGVVEGLAEALAPPSGTLDVHRRAKALLDAGRIVAFGDMLTAQQFYTHPSAQSYPACGSFVAFLLERYGVEALRCVYRSANFDGCYSQTLPQLESYWRAYLDDIVFSASEKNQAAAYLATSADRIDNFETEIVVPESLRKLSYAELTDRITASDNAAIRARLQDYMWRRRFEEIVKP